MNNFNEWLSDIIKELSRYITHVKKILETHCVLRVRFNYGSIRIYRNSITFA